MRYEIGGKMRRTENFVLIQDVSETAADHLIDDDECLLSYDLNRSKNLDLPYHST